jgi:hypothetical protein
MITEFKIYENDDQIMNIIQLGYYVIMKRAYLVGATEQQKAKMDEFLEHNIGEIINTNNVYNNITVKYHNTSFYVDIFFDNNGEYLTTPDFIVEYAPTVNELKMKLEAKKFNL